MTLKVLFFSLLRDLVKDDEMTVTLPEGATVAELLTHLEAQFPELKSWRGRVLVAADHDYVTAETELRNGQEVAIMPPVQGG